MSTVVHSCNPKQNNVHSSIESTVAEPQFDLAIIMAVRNEEKFIGNTLGQLCEQDFPLDKLEVVIADGASTDRTVEVVQYFKGRFGSLKVLNNPGLRSAYGRNIGVKNSTAPCVLILDGHTHLCNKTFLKDVIEIFRSTDAKCLCRPQPLDPPDISGFEKTVAICRSSILGHNPGSEIYADFEGIVDPTASGAMYTRDVFHTIGYFDEDFDACEDVDFNHRVERAGLKSFLSPKLRVYYYPRSTIKKLWKQMIRYGAGRFRFARKHRIINIILWFAGAAVLGFLLMFMASFFWPQVRLVFLGFVAFYILLITLFSIVLARRHEHLHCLLWGPLIFPTIHFGLGVGFLQALVSTSIKR